MSHNSGYNLIHARSSNNGSILPLKCDDANDTLGNTPRHLTIDGNGRTLVTPYENPNSWRTLYLGNIKDNTNILRDVESITTDSAGGALVSTWLSGVATASVDMVAHKHIQFRVDIPITGSDPLEIQGSDDNTTFYGITEVYTNTLNMVSYYTHKITKGAYRYYRIQNNSGSSLTFTTIKIRKLNV